MKRKIQFSRLFMGFSSVSLFLLLLATLTQVQSSIAAEETKEQTAVNTAINPQSDLAISQRFPSNLIQPKNATGPAIYIVALKDIPLATYDGSIPGLAATNPTVRGETKLDAKSADSVAYLNYLSQRRADVINQANTVLGRQLEIMFEYGASINGFAAEMTPDEASLVAQLPNVFLVEREKIYELQTDAGPGWIGAPGVWDGSQTGGLPGTYGEGVIVGIIDTGVDPWNPSFADVGDDGYDHTNPFGSNNYVGVCDPTNLGGGGVVAFDPTFDCNDKLIGVWGYTASDPSPRDTDGHGSHTSSTAAGNFVYDAVITTTTAVFTANISGVAPHANLIVYDGCTDGAGCPGASLQAARDQAILDGVDVINYSIGGNSPTGNPWIDVEALSWLNVRAAGIFVADSAGNDGPGEASVDSPADIPWINPVAASSHNRTFLNSVTLDDGVNTPVTIEGESMTGPLSTPVEVVFAADYGVGDDYRLCAPGIFPANTFDGEIVICERGVYGRVDKGQSVLDGGGGGMILAQPAEFGGGPGALASDPHVLPAVHINYYEYQDLLAYMNNAPGAVMGTIAGSTLALGDEYGDIIASFSSRGPNESVPDLIAPYMAAPGRAIWAAYHQGAEDGQYTFNVIQGTSMASPHVAGAAALMVALHPDWSPAEIQSALMTTSDTTVVNDDGSTQATPFQMGAGRVSLADAAKAGFVLDVTTQEFIDANPGIGGDPKTLNLANIGNADCLNSCTWTRTISSTLPYTVSWVATTVSPLSATLSVEPVTFDLAPYGTQVITVTADTTAMPYGEWSFGQVNLEPAAAVLQLTKDDGGVTVTEGEDIAYTLSYENVGELAATNVIITETVPDNTTFNAAASTAGWTEASSGIYTFDVGSVVSSGNGTVLFVVTVDDPLAQGVTAIDNTAQITGDGLSVGSASDSTPVGEPTEFTIYLPVVFNASTNVASQSQRALNATMAVPVDLVSEAHFPVALYAEQPSPIIDVTPEDLSSSQTPDVSTTLPLTITNLGQADLEWSVYEGNAPVKMSGLGWADNFDSYATNSQLHGQGGWKGWGNDPNAGALAVSTQARSAPNSAEITGPSDLVQEYSGYTSGVWNYTAWQYIPGSFSGESYFILLNAYDDAGATNNWSTQVRFNSVGSVVIADGAGGGATLPLVTDQWVEIRVEIDLNNDQQTFYYDGQMLFQGSWTEGLSGGGQLAIGAVDLYANGATAVYYDDLSLTESGWSDNFDSYATNSQIHGQGGWKGWANDPNAGAIVVSTQARSTPNSVDITGPSDLVHEYSGYTSGAWNYTAWQYIPGDFTGESYFILLNSYDDAGASNNWSVQVHFNSVGDVVIADGVGGSATLPLTRDQWVEINVIIDLDNDSQSFYYDGQLLYQGSWTEGVSGGGQLNIGAVDLYANSASSIFYDDMSLTPTSAQGCSNPADVPWLSVTPTSGTTSGGASDVLDVTMDSTGLTAGNYGGVLCVSSNDPVNPLIQVPVSLSVTGNPPIVDVSPGDLNATLPSGGTSTEVLTVGNSAGSGSEDLDWSIDEDNNAIAKAPAVVLYDNGPLVNSPGTGAGGADESMLQGNLGMTLFGFGHSVAAGLRVSDQFTVTDAAGWTIDQITFFGYQTGSPTTSTFTEVNYNIWDGPPNDPNSVMIYSSGGNALINTVWANIYRVTDTTSGNTQRPVMANTVSGGMFLTQGTYWLDWQSGGSLTSGPWAPPITINGQTATGDGLQFTAGSWVALTDVGPQGLPFVVEGSVGGAALPCELVSDIPWASVSPDAGTNAPGTSTNVDVVFDATGLTAGDYSGYLCVNSNDPVTPLVTVALSLTVTGNPPAIDVNPSDMDATVPAGSSSTQGLGISNVGVSGAANLNWNVDEANGALLMPAQETASGAVDSVAYVAAEGFAFSANPNPTETVLHGLPTRNPGTTITHSNSQTVVAGSVSCNSGGFHTDSSYYRAFDLPSFGITNAFEISSVDFGIEQATGNGGSQPVVVNLYAAPSGTAFPAAYPGSFTLIGTANVTVADQTLSVLNAPIAATAPANSVVVFELFTPSGQPDVNSFFVGSNAAGQTAPSYIAAAACGISSPIDLAAIGFPNMHIVMNVTGKVQAPATGCAAPSDIPWLSMTPTSGSTAQGATDNVDVTFDATALGTGVYTGTICVNSDDPVTPLVEVPVTLTVTPGGPTPGISVNKTVGTDPNVCAGTDQVTVASGTDVTYCYTVTNTGSITLTQHDLVDDQLGTLLTGFPYSLPPGGSAFITATTNITATTVNVATWTAYNPGPIDVASDTDTATVTVSGGGGTVTYCRNALALAIPDNNTTGVNDTLSVTESGTIQDVDVLVNATHSWDGDLMFMVTSPAATTVTIVDRPGYTGTGFGCNGDNYPNITLDDDPGGTPGTSVETSCTNTIPGYTPNGSYTPNNPLSAFDGSSLNGTWTINASDRAAGDTGNLTDWCVTITYGP